MTCRLSWILIFLGAVIVLVTKPSTVEAVKCYVCRSKTKDDNCYNVKKDDTPLIDCSYAPQGNNKFLTTVFGKLKGGKDKSGKITDGYGPKTMMELGECPGTDKEDCGWTEKHTPRTDVGTPGNNSMKVRHLYEQMYIITTGEGTKKVKTLNKMPPYEICRTLTIDAPETVVKDGKKLEQRRTVVRLCGWKQPDGHKPGSCKDYKGRGGVVHSCVCDSDGCNNENGVSGLTSTPKWIAMFAAITYITTLYLN